MQSLHYVPAKPCPDGIFDRIWLHFMQLTDLVDRHRMQPYQQSSVHPIGNTIALQIGQPRQWDDGMLQNQLFSWLENISNYMPCLQDHDCEDTLRIILFETPGQVLLYSKTNQRLVWHYNNHVFELRKNAASSGYTWLPQHITPDTILQLCENLLHLVWEPHTWGDDLALNQLEYLVQRSDVPEKQWADLQFIYLGWLLNNSSNHQHIVDLWQWVEHAYDEPRDALKMFISTLKNPVHDECALNVADE